MSSITIRVKVSSNIIYYFFTPDLILQSYATIPDPTEKILVSLLLPSHSQAPDFFYVYVGAQRIMYLVDS